MPVTARRGRWPPWTPPWRPTSGRLPRPWHRRRHCWALPAALASCSDRASESRRYRLTRLPAPTFGQRRGNQERPVRAAVRRRDLQVPLRRAIPNMVDLSLRGTRRPSISSVIWPVRYLPTQGRHSRSCPRPVGPFLARHGRRPPGHSRLGTADAWIGGQGALQNMCWTGRQAQHAEASTPCSTFGEGSSSGGRPASMGRYARDAARFRPVTAASQRTVFDLELTQTTTDLDRPSAFRMLEASG